MTIVGIKVMLRWKTQYPRLCGAPVTGGSPARSRVAHCLTLIPAATSLMSIAFAGNLPVPCSTGACGATGPSSWVSSGSATATQTATQMNINQQTNQAILNWQSFNIAAGSAVKFNQPGSSSIALNRIFQNDPSKIFGNLTANGQIYLINQNGIIFGAHSQVNVNSLIASTLNLKDSTFLGGIIQPNLLIDDQPAFFSDGRMFAVDQNGNMVAGADGHPIPVAVEVQAGAQIASQSGGRVMLLGQQVDNAGAISAPGGQVILAAGQKAYLQASSDPSLRGLIVEVDGGGSVSNQLTGQISATTGNVTLLGLAVNQDGRISATTSVNFNGSIRLLAEDSHVVANRALSASATGTLELGAQSVTSVVPDFLDPATAAESQLPFASSIQLVGHQIHLAGGSAVAAVGGPSGGQVLIDATQNPYAADQGTVIPPDPGSQIRIDSGASIDVSGSNVNLPMSSNIISAQLRGNELRNDPQQRNGVLRGQTVYVDTRAANGKGTVIADVSGEIGNIARSVGQLATKGGTISVLSEGDAVLAQGATLNVSGGSVAYSGGVIATTQLVGADGHVYDIGSADPNLTYTGVINPIVSTTNTKWGVVSNFPTFVSNAHYEPGYVEGADAGTVQFAGRTLVVNGTLLGSAIAGPLQRTAASQPLGGQLIIGNPNGGKDYVAPYVEFRSDPLPISVAPGTPLVGLLDTLELPTTYLTAGGFSRTTVYSNGRIVVPAGLSLDLRPNSAFSLTAPAIDLSSSISSPGGSIQLTSNIPTVAVLPFPGRGGIVVGDGVTLDVSGRWVNDAPFLAGGNPTDAIVNNGGAVSLSMSTPGGELTLGTGVHIDVSAGAYAAPNGATTLGSAGSIALTTTADNSAFQIGNGDSFTGYGINGSAGGRLTIVGNRLQIVHNNDPWPVTQRVDFSDPTALSFNLSDSLFSQGGFSSFTIAANGPKTTDLNQVTVAPLIIGGNASIDALVATRMLPADVLLQQGSGARLASFAPAQVPPDYLRLPVNLGFSVYSGPNAATPTPSVTPGTAGDLIVASGAQLSADPKSVFSFIAPTNIHFGGTLDAPAGTISLTLATPSSALEAGYIPTQGIYLERGSLLDVSGTTVFSPSATGLRTGQVLTGGAVSVIADRGSIFGQTGSAINVSGGSATLDIPTGSTQTSGVTAENIASAGGSVTLIAPESIFLDTALSGQSGSAAGTPGPGGGSITIALSRYAGFVPLDSGNTTVPPFPATPRAMVVGPPGQRPTADATLIDPAAIQTAGFSSVTLAADDVINLVAGTNISVNRQLALQAPNLTAIGNGPITLSAPVVSLGPTNPATQASNAPTPGKSMLSVQADLIQLNGNIALQGVSQTSLSASHDLQAIGVLSGQQLIGSFTASGSLQLAASEIYPTTLSQFSISVPNGSIDTRSTGSAVPVLSAGGSLTLSAAQIDHEGVIEAPFGHVAFNASQSVMLGAGSSVSVTGQGQTIPFGETQNGTAWVYNLTPSLSLTSNPALAVLAPPDKQVSLSAPSVHIATGASVDISGGGEVYAYEFLPGLGGSIDALSPAISPNTFAILPQMHSYAPFDAEYSSGSSLHPGAAVYLSGVPGQLAAGTYTLLPARYALLPGAFLVTAVAGQQDLPPGQFATAANGAPIVSGYLTTLGTGLRDSRTSGFEIQPGSYAHQLAEYDTTSANAFFAAQAAASGTPVPRLPQDAGALSLSVVNSLLLDGSINAKPAGSGRGATVDLSANNLQIVSAASGNSDNGVQVSSSSLESLGAQSLLIGGSRSTASDGSTVVTVAAQDVTLAANTFLSAPEILLVAQDTVSVDAGAKLTAAGTSGVLDGGSLTLNSSTGSSALARVSSGAQVDVRRTAPSATFGSVDVAQGAVLSAMGSITLSATRDTRSQGTLNANQGSLSLVASRISLGDGATANQGLVISGAELNLFGKLSDLRLISQSTIDLYNGVTLGSFDAQGAASLGSLVLDSSAIRGFDTNGATATLSAGAVRVTDSQTSAAQPTAGIGTGNLLIEGASLELGKGSYGFSGFQNTTLASRGDLIANGSVAIAAQSNLTLQGTRILGKSGAVVAIDDGVLAFQTRAATLDPKLAVTTPGLGVIFGIKAGSIQHNGDFELPSGQLTFDASKDVSLASGSVIDAAGTVQMFGNVPVNTPGGSVIVKSNQGNATLASGAHVDVSSGHGGGNAGSLEVDAAGTASLDASLAAQSRSGASGGSFTLVVGQIGDFASLTRSLNSAGFSRQQDFRVRTGDLNLFAGSEILAQHVALAADAGAVTIEGRIDARGATGGTVRLSAGGNVTLAASGSIQVDASGSSATGGTVEFDTSHGTIATAGGSTISANGRSGGGTVIFRAPAAGNDVAITALDGTISGANSVIARVVSVYDNVSTVDSALQATVSSDLANFSATATTIAQRLGQLNNAAFAVQAGVELRSAGDMLVSDSWDLYGFRPNGLPGELTLRAAGNLNIGGNISDGFLSAAAGPQPQAGPSWSYRLTGGADLGAANPDAVLTPANLASGAGNLVIGSGVSVRTGTGSISANAAQDLVFQDQTAVLLTSGTPVASMPPIQYPNLQNATLNWTSGGGDINIFAGRDVVGAASNQIITSWQLREVSNTSPLSSSTLWGTDFSRFQENVGALGGGNVNVFAGRDVLNFSAVIPTTGMADRATVNEEVWGGGNLDVAAGRDLTGGVYYVGRGTGNVRAGRSITTGSSLSGNPIAPVLALGDGALNVTAGNTLEINSVLNPTLIGQPITRPTARTYFSTYSPTSSVDLLALSGDLTLLNSHAAFVDAVGKVIGDNTSTSIGLPADLYYPGQTSAAAVGGSINVKSDFLLFPSAVGRLDLLAADTITARPPDGKSFGISQPDVNPASIPTPFQPSKSANATSLILSQTQGIASSLHNNDSTPSNIIARQGDILGGSLTLSGPANLIAGRDMVGVSLYAENFQPTDVTLIQAGRDITYANADATVQISVGGPGYLDILAGRNIDLGSTVGISTTGATLNPGLPGSTGAGVNILAGLGRQPDYQGFIKKYLIDGSTFSAQLTQFIQSLTGNSDLKPAAALDAFENLSLPQQLPLISAVFFDELNQAGLEATAKQKPGYVRGFNAINTLFPGSLNSDGTTPSAAMLPYQGNLQLDFSRIYTLAGGDINLMVPGGLLNVGLANPPVNAPYRTPAQLGIVAQGTGSVNAFTFGDVLVNQSRIFTLDGGDIVIWSSTGNIDAGRGAKTAISAPPPILIVQPDGTVTVDFAGAVAGSGIRTILTQPGVVPGNVDLIAPVGIVNASDAGIGSAGNLNIAAATVLGANNINVGGAATGVPSATNSLAAGLAGVSNAATSASKEAASDVASAAAAQKTSPVADSALSWLDVFVTGLGEDNCKPDDIDCLARQKKK